MKILNRGATRSVPGIGLIDHGEELDLNDEDGNKLLAIGGFKLMDEDLNGDEDLTCPDCGKELGSKSSLNRHKKTHGDD